MSTNLIIKVSFLLLTFYPFISATIEYNFMDGYISEYSNAPQYDAGTPECLSICMQNHIKDFYFFGISRYLSNNNCFCNMDRTFSTITNSPQYRTMLIWRPPINFETHSFQIGATRKIHVFYLQNIGETNPNSIFRYYAADSLLNVTKKSGRLIIDYTTVTNEAGSSQNENDFEARKFNIHEITKRNTSIEETFETITQHPQWLQGAYSFNVHLVDMDLVDDESLYFVSILENDFITIVDIKPLPVVRRPNQNCDALFKTNQQLLIDKEFLINVFMSTETDCVIDLKNISMVFYFEDIIQPQVKQNESCIDPTTIQVKKNKIMLKFDVLYIHSEICFDLSFTTNTTLKGIGSRKTTIFNEIKYQKYVDNVPTTVQLNNSFTTYISKGEKAFYIRDETEGTVLEFNKEDERLTFPAVKTRSLYVYFKLHPHNLKAMNGQCLGLAGGGKLKYVECKDRKRLKNSAFSSQYYSGKYIGTPGFTVSKPTDVRRKYIGAFGLNGNGPPAYEDKKNVSVTRLTLGNSVILCTTPNKRGSRCVRLYMERSGQEVRRKRRFIFCLIGLCGSKKKSSSSPSSSLSASLLNTFTVFPEFMHEVLAKHNETDDIFARDGNGRIFRFQIDDIRSRSFISNQLYEKLLTDNKLIIANKSDPDHLENGKEITFDDGSQITSLGFKTEASGKYKIIWSSNHQICEGIKNLRIVNFESCKQIIQYCKNAKSGVYGVMGFPSRDIINWKKVYCDMETDEGGWLMIANIVIRNGNFTSLDSMITNNIGDVVLSNYQQVMGSPVTIYNVFRYFMRFDQFRFFCYGDHVKRTIHMKTTFSASGYSTWGGFLGQTNRGDQCKSLDILYDDTSIIGSSCDRISSTLNPNPLYFDTFDLPNERAFSYGYNNLMACDDYANLDIQNGDWRIYIR